MDHKLPDMREENTEDGKRAQHIQVPGILLHDRRLGGFLFYFLKNTMIIHLSLSVWPIFLGRASLRCLAMRSPDGKVALSSDDPVFGVGCAIAFDPTGGTNFTSLVDASYYVGAFGTPPGGTIPVQAIVATPASSDAASFQLECFANGSAIAINAILTAVPIALGVQP
jgi:hypothetical protein